MRSPYPARRAKTAGGGAAGAAPGRAARPGSARLGQRCCGAGSVSGSQYLRARQPGRPIGIRGGLDQLPGVRVAEFQLGRGQGVEQARVVLAQHLAQPLQVPGPVSDQALVGARDQLQTLDLG
jgi:hypothetical protein